MTMPSSRAESRVAGAESFEDSTNDTGKAVAFGGIIIAVLIFLVVLRFLINMLIDWLILGRGSDGSWRDLENVWTRIRRALCCQSTNNADEGHDDGGNQLDEIEKMSYHHRVQRINSLLPDFRLTRQSWKEILKQRQQYQPGPSLDPSEKQQAQKRFSSPTGTTCSICIHELCLGDLVFLTEHCRHVFHKKCIVQWILSRSIPPNSIGTPGPPACPNCRQEMLSPALAEQIVNFFPSEESGGRTTDQQRSVELQSIPGS